MWIEGVPLLFMIGSANTSTGNKTTRLASPKPLVNQYGMNQTAALDISNVANSTAASPFTAMTSTYSFRLGFAGNPLGSWILRWNSGTTFSTTNYLVFHKAIDLRDGLPGVILQGYSSNGWVSLRGNIFSNASQGGYFYGKEYIFNNLYTNNPLDVSDYPLVPIQIGFVKALKAYTCFPYNGFPLASTYNADQLTEITIGSKKFLYTNINVGDTSSSAVNFINAGLIELDD